MAKLLLAILLFVCAVLAPTGCIEIPPEPCDASFYCVTVKGIDGYCVAAGDGKKYCIFPDSTCSSMWRWSNLANDELKNRCADPSVVPSQDGGMDGGPVDAASLDDA